MIWLRSFFKRSSLLSSVTFGTPIRSSHLLANPLNTRQVLVDWLHSLFRPKLRSHSYRKTSEMSFFSLGKDTFKVPMKMHSDNRQRVVQRMIAAGAAKEGVIVVQGGAAGYRDATDHEHLFRQESFFHYLFGVKESECFGAIDIHNNKSILFIPRLPVEYAVWMGKIQPPSYFQELYAVDSVRYADEITSVLKDELKASVLYTLKGKNTDSGNEHLEAKFEGIQDFKVNSDLLYPEIVECRLIKSEDELNLMRYVNRISSEAHMEVMRQAKAGLAEFQAVSKPTS
eukprot:TRINITY_DN2763_c0_g1_i2.p1 TRINITY_DN2763_c0_g1~~TRINITY_DN2763_c0_g1_i2.p1  ORF type:complete len:285 (+),score=49.03 TRINITY_DN2763_c0_g1_i2:559-1413(+)